MHTAPSRGAVRVLVCENLALYGAYTPVPAKHSKSKSFSLIDCVAVGVDRMQRNFEPMRRQLAAWRKCELTDVTAKVAIYEASSRANWRLQSILLTRFTISISNRHTTSSSRGRSGACPTPSLRRSRHSNRSRSLEPLPSWASSWKRASQSRSSIGACRLGCRA